jgi:sec-independent protein translocase protein TatA
MHLVVIFGIALLVFGPKKLPELGKGIGEGIRGFKSALREEEKPAALSRAKADQEGSWVSAQSSCSLSCSDWWY